MAPRRTIIAIVGPTGTGKTALGLAIAAHLGTEVISVDSLQCYEHGNIVTAAPTAAETEQVKHHMVGYLQPDEEPGEEFVLRAVEVADGLHAKGKVPILVGGSTSLMLPLLFAPARGSYTDHALKGSSIDAAGKSSGRLRWRTLLIILNAKTQESLEKRLDARVEDMLAVGLEKEVQDLYSLQKKLLPEQNERNMRRGVWKCIGYQELYSFLVATDNTLRVTPSPAIQPHGNGNANRLVEEVADAEQAERLLREGIELMKENTRRYAQSQITWVESVLAPALRKEEMPVHRFEIPYATCEEEEEKEGGFKNRWLESVEGPALRLCEAWRAAAQGDDAGPGAVTAVSEEMKENNHIHKFQQYGNSDRDVICYRHGSFLTA